MLEISRFPILQSARDFCPSPHELCANLRLSRSFFGFLNEFHRFSFEENASKRLLVVYFDTDLGVSVDDGLLFAELSIFKEK